MIDQVPLDTDGMKPDLTCRGITICEHQMNYVTGGHGDPVILLHGLGAGNFVWRRTLPVLARHYTVYAPDMLGCGTSDKPLIDYTIESLTQHVHLFMEANRIERAHFIAHSMGGVVAVKLRYLFPQLVNRLVLVSSGGMGRDVHWLFRAGTLPGLLRIMDFLDTPLSYLERVTLAIERYFMRKLHVVDEPELPTLFERLRNKEALRVFLHMLRAVGNPGGQTVNVLPYLSFLSDTPVLVLWGARDPIIPVTHGLRASQLIPRGHLEVLPGCFHEPQVEASQLFNAHILNFLRAGTWPPRTRLLI